MDIFDKVTHIFGRSRKTDPETSKEAGEKNRKGLTIQGGKVFAAIKEVNGGTRGEIGRFLSELEGISFHEAIAMVSRRAPDLAKIGVVRRGEPRKCHYLNSSQTTWWIVK